MIFAIQNNVPSHPTRSGELYFCSALLVGSRHARVIGHLKCVHLASMSGVEFSCTRANAVKFLLEQGNVSIKEIGNKIFW